MVLLWCGLWVIVPHNTNWNPERSILPLAILCMAEYRTIPLRQTALAQRYSAVLPSGAPGHPMPFAHTPVGAAL